MTLRRKIQKIEQIASRRLVRQHGVRRLEAEADISVFGFARLRLTDQRRLRELVVQMPFVVQCTVVRVGRRVARVVDQRLNRVRRLSLVLRLESDQQAHSDRQEHDENHVRCQGACASGEADGEEERD